MTFISSSEVKKCIFHECRRSENISFFYIFTSENITFSKYAFYFINNSLYFITLYIIKKVITFLTLFHSISGCRHCDEKCNKSEKCNIFL